MIKRGDEELVRVLLRVARELGGFTPGADEEIDGSVGGRFVRENLETNQFGRQTERSGIGPR